MHGITKPIWRVCWYESFTLLDRNIKGNVLVIQISVKILHKKYATI